jgi:HlyD family secretion protein
LRRLRAPAGGARDSGLQHLTLVLIAALVGGGVLVALARAGWLRAGDDQAVRGAVVQRGPLRISVVESGNLKAADSVSLRSEIEGQTTILYLVPEGTLVEEGQLVCELDATEQIDERFQQQISVRNAEAAYVKSQQNHEIQKSQNDSDIKKAEQALDFARIDLEKFREGERKAQEAEADEAIKLGEEEFTRASEQLEWSQKLYEKGFLTNTELEADRLALSRAQIQLEQARRDKDLLIRFQLPRDEADLVAKLEEAQRELDRVRLQAAARIVDFEADMTTNEAKLRLEREKLAKLETQIEKARIHAPRAGMVVYAQEEGGRYGGSNPIKEGTQVRERQEIITIPSAEGMIAQVSLHESVLKQVEPGQPATIKVDALPGREFRGRVRFVSVMADQNSWWANPNLRVYRTEISIDEPSPDMRPGMSCVIEILADEIADALFVPVQAVYRKGRDNVAFVDGSGAIEERAVEVGRYNDRWVQILSGLEEGEVVLLAPPAGFSLQAEEQEDQPGEGAEPGGPPGVPGAPAGERAGPGSGPTAASLPAVDTGGDAAQRGQGAERRRSEDEQGGERSAEEFRRRFENMSAEERARLQERFRGRRAGGEGGGGEARGGAAPGAGG